MPEQSDSIENEVSGQKDDLGLDKTKLKKSRGINRIIIGVLLFIGFLILSFTISNSKNNQPIQKKENVVTTVSKTPNNKKQYTLLIIDSQTGHPYDISRKAMLEELARLGYSEGKNLKTTYYSIGNDKAKGIEILKKELPNYYDVIFLNGTIITTAAKEVAYGKPEYKFVFASVTDPVGVGVIDDFINPPKANFTGTSFPVPVKSRLKFVKDLMPGVKTIGLIYADMPQSQSYKKWLDDLLATDPEFKNIHIIYRKVPLVTGDDGSQKMTELAKKYVIELNPEVDVFLSPNDQMASKKEFATMVYATATKPLVGLQTDDIMQHWGATMTMSPAVDIAGKQCAVMINKLFEGEKISSILPEWTNGYVVAFDLGKAKRFGIQIPVDMIDLAGDNIVK